MGIVGSITTCSTDSPLLNESSSVAVSDSLGPVTMECADFVTNTASMSAQARAHPDSPPDIAVVASSTGAGAIADARATFDDFATISPFLGLSALDVTFNITAPYLLTLDLPSTDSEGAAVVSLQLPLYAFVDAQLTHAGEASGTLNTGDITVSNCPCTIEILGTVEVGGRNGAGGSARDPFTINLPPGWAYTLASAQQAQVGTVPEPSSLAMVLSGLAAGIVRIRRIRRTRSP
jgi:hypothetical protein